MNILANIISLTIVFAVPLMLVALGGMYSDPLRLLFAPGI